ncbi:MAG: MFS transporter [Pseudomonadota bacterium]
MKRKATSLSPELPVLPPPAATSRTATLWVVSVTQFVTPFMFSAVGVALPAIGREFSAGAMALGLIEMIYVLATAMLLLPMGRLSDIYGRKKLFITGMAVLMVATLALSFAPNTAVFIAFRFLQGTGAAMVASTSFAILTSTFPPECRGRAMGIVVSCVYLGLSAGPSLAGLMVTHLGWRWIFYVAVPVEAVALSLTLWKLRGEWADAAGEKFDWSGSLIYMTALLCLVLGLSHLKDWVSARWLACGGAALILFFIRHELRLSTPLISIRPLMQNRSFALSSVATWLNYATASGSVFFFSLYLQSIKGFSSQTAGFIIVVQPIIQAVIAPIAGRLADRYSPSKIATIGMSICAIGLLAAARLTETSSLHTVFGVLIPIGIGFGVFSTPNTAVIMASVQARDYGMASSMLATMRSMGMLTSMTIVTFLLSWFMGNQPVSIHTGHDFMNSMRTTFIIFSVLSLMGIVCSLGRIAPGRANSRLVSKK